MNKYLKLFCIFLFYSCSAANAQQMFLAGDVLPEPANTVYYKKWNPQNKTLMIIDDNKGATVLWKTMSTINASRFELQRAEGSNDFVSIKQIRANATTGWSNYDLGFRQTAVVEQMVTYRLKLIFKDGTVDYSDATSVEKVDAEGVKGYLMLVR